MWMAGDILCSSRCWSKVNTCRCMGDTNLQRDSAKYCRARIAHHRRIWRTLPACSSDIHPGCRTIHCRTVPGILRHCRSPQECKMLALPPCWWQGVGFLLGIIRLLMKACLGCLIWGWRVCRWGARHYHLSFSTGAAGCLILQVIDISQLLEEWDRRRRCWSYPQQTAVHPLGCQGYKPMSW